MTIYYDQAASLAYAHFAQRHDMMMEETTCELVVIIYTKRVYEEACLTL